MWSVEPSCIGCAANSRRALGSRPEFAVVCTRFHSSTVSRMIALFQMAADLTDIRHQAAMSHCTEHTCRDQQGPYQKECQITFVHLSYP